MDFELKGRVSSGEIDQRTRWNRRAAAGPKINYDADCESLKWVAPSRTLEMLVPHLSQGSVILDIGCGSGLVGERLIQRGFVVDGVDFSDEMLKRASARGYRNLTCASVEQDLRGILPAYDALVSVGVFGDCVSPDFLCYSCQLLNPGGVFAVAGRKGLAREFEDVLESSGLEIVEAKQGFAHFTISGNPVDYTYVVAKR